MRLRAAALLIGIAVLATSACGQSRKNEAPPESRPTYAIVTSLPLFWGEEKFGAALGKEDQRALIIQRLSDDANIRPIDAIEGNVLDGVTTLILAQPRLLAPQELVLIDAWVRRGGRVIAFADPLLDWPSELALGDKRRAPPVTLLDPLFSHWGLALQGGSDGVLAERMLNADLITTIGAGHWVAQNKDCVVEPDGLVARCAIGKGRSTWIADADLLDHRANDGAQIESAERRFDLITALIAGSR